MKILLTNTSSWGTGSTTAVEGIARELMQQGHQVKVFFPDCQFESLDMDKYYGDPGMYHIWKFPVKKSGTELYTFPLIISNPHPRNFMHAWTFKLMTEAQLRLYNSNNFHNSQNSCKCVETDSTLSWAGNGTHHCCHLVGDGLGPEFQAADGK